MVANEFVATSITSRPPAEEMVQSLARLNPHVEFATGLHRGYVRLQIAARELRSDLVAVDALQAGAPQVIRSFVVADGEPLKPA